MDSFSLFQDENPWKFLELDQPPCVYTDKYQLI